jgi:hypothetical protein
MKLSSPDIKELQIIYLKEFGVKISTNKARKLGNQLINLFKLLIKPSRKIYDTN